MSSHPIHHARQVQLIPKAPRRKKQPSADELRRQLVAAAERIIEVEADNARLRKQNEAALAALWGRTWVGASWRWFRVRFLA